MSGCEDAQFPGAGQANQRSPRDVSVVVLFLLVVLLLFGLLLWVSLFCASPVFGLAVRLFRVLGGLPGFGIPRPDAAEVTSDARDRRASLVNETCWCQACLQASVLGARGVHADFAVDSLHCCAGHVSQTWKSKGG